MPQRGDGKRSRQAVKKIIALLGVVVLGAVAVWSAETGEADSPDNPVDLIAPNWEASDNGLGTRTQSHASRIVSWLLKAAERGSVRSQTCLGDIYRAGVLTPKDTTEAAKWYRRAAEAGDAEAMYALGRLYFVGDGVDHSNVDAAKWFREAAREGHRGGQAIYGYMCSKGLGVPLDYALAWNWLTRAAAQGSAAAMHNLGLMHVTGTGVPRDLVEAYKWFTLAIPRLRVEPRMTTQHMRAKIAARMTFEEIAEAERRVRAWEDR